MVSVSDKCKRFLITLIRTLAPLYGCSVKVTRDSSNADARTAYRTVSKKAHPDHGGHEEDQKRFKTGSGDIAEAADLPEDIPPAVSAALGGKDAITPANAAARTRRAEE